MSTISDDFNERLEAFINRYGLAKAGDLLEMLTYDAPSGIPSSHKVKFYYNFLQLEALCTFDVTNEEFFKARLPLAKEARWTLIHLMKAYTQCSYDRIGRFLKMKPRAVRYARIKCDELLEVPKFEKAFNERYRELEEKLVAFIAKI